MKKSLLLLSAGSMALISSVSGQTLVPDLASTGRIMTGSGPLHLNPGGGSSILGVVNTNDTGDMIVGDNGGNSLNFSLIIGFDTTPAFRTAVANGATITFSGSTLYGVPDGFGGTDVKSTGSVDWAPISASVNGYGNSTTGTYGDSNNFRRHGAFNQQDANGVTSFDVYSSVGPVVFAGDPYAADTTFSIDMTTAIAALGLDASLDRVMLGLSAWDASAAPSLTLVSNDSIADRVAFQPSTFTLTAVPEPSTYAVIFGVLTLVGVMIRRRFKN